MARAAAAPGLAAILLRSARRSGRGRAERPEVILHAGEHKTGTTSIQAVILRERRTLARQGVHVVRTGQGTDGAHHRLIYTLTGQPLGRASKRLFRLELIQTPPRRALISSETTKKVIVGGGGPGLIESLREAGAGRIRLLLYLRSPFGLANASYAGLTSRLELAGASLSEFLEAHDGGPAYRYDRFLELTEREDVELVVRPYSAAARRSVVGDFADAIGVDLQAAAEPRHNTSLGPVGLEAMRRIAPELGPLDLALRHRLRHRLREIAKGLGERPFWGMDAAHEALLATADRRTEAFARAVWGRSWRESIGEEKRPLNRFEADDEGQRALLEATLERMRRATAAVLG